MTNYVPVRTSTNIQTAIGRRLYPDPHLAIVELVSNSYDADAEKVNVLVTPSQIAVIDDGRGMSQEILYDFFTVGQSTKPPSTKARKPIGSFGIGKFAVLSMADEFDIFTKSGEYRARAIYSHTAALASGKYLSDYNVPVDPYATESEYRIALMAAVGTEAYYDPNQDGVTIVMKNLHREYSDAVIKQRLSEILVPHAKDEFEIYVNEELLKERYIHGMRYNLNLTTSFGPVVGEIVIAADSIDLGDQTGVQIRVRGRGIRRTYFGLDNYDSSARKLSGYVQADWLNPVIGSNRVELIDSPEKTAFEDVVREAIRSILDQEATKRMVDNEEKKKRILDKAVRTVTSVLNKLPEFDFPKRPLQSMVPVGALDDVVAGKDASADIEPEGMSAEITAARGTRAFSEFLDFMKQIAAQFNVDPSDLPSNIQTISEALDLIEKILHVKMEDLLGTEGLNRLLGAIPENQVTEHIQVEGILRLAAKRLQEFIRKTAVEEAEQQPLQNAKLAAGVSPHLPVTNALELNKIKLSPIAPPNDMTMLDLKVNPLESGYVPDAPQARINNFIAASVEHLGEDGPASLLAEGLGFDGVQIYINADHPVYTNIQENTSNVLAFYQAQLIFGEVILMQNFTPRESMEKQAELLRLLLQIDKNILKG
jgi:hypothetical protein